ncbi:MAG: M1 family metallopeptidase [Pseudomonadota bacterium]
MTAPFKKFCFGALLVATAAFLVGCGDEVTGLSGGALADALIGREGQAQKAEEAERATQTAALFDPAAADRVDVFTYSNYDAVAVRDADFDLVVDFDKRTLKGFVTLAFDRLDPNAPEIVLDTAGLVIASVEALRPGTNRTAVPSGSDENNAPTSVWTAAPFLIGAWDEMMGAPLTIELPDGATKVRIAYETAPSAAGLQWLTAEQTAAGEGPFVYSQAQAIHARSMAPLQDTPALRMTYTARIRLDGAPDDALALMAARQDPDGARDGDYRFEMRQPVPPYLFALAAGDLAFKPISDTIGVYAEDYILEASAAEFADAPAMATAAEQFYGPYRWERYDMLVLPPSFPYGGMENPRLTFLTPTLVAGDKSLTDVVAHEIAHSWSGNLVTNATWRDAWLNEGFTTYVENRIMEALYGPERALMERALDHEKLLETLAAAERPERTRLKLPAGIDHPSAGFTRVSYIKGAFFLRFLEERFGRAAFDAFLKDYFDAFAFKAVVTEDFLAFLQERLMAANPDTVSADEIREWVLGPGLPETFDPPQSDRFSAVAAQQADWLEGLVAASDLETEAWSTHEWLSFINTLPPGLQETQYTDLDAAFGLSTAENAEIAFAWYRHAVASDYAPAFDPLEGFLRRVGRMKYVIPLYEDLSQTERREWAAAVYAEARAGYHPIAQSRVDTVFAPIE